MEQEELVQLLRNLSAIEGFLLSSSEKGFSTMFDNYIDPSVEIILKELNNERTIK